MRLFKEVVVVKAFGPVLTAVLCLFLCAGCQGVKQAYTHLTEVADTNPKPDFEWDSEYTTPGTSLPQAERLERR